MLIWSSNAWEDYLYWQQEDRKTLKRINKLLKDIERHPYEGLGKPEPLKGDKHGYWSRRINEKDRLVYRVTEQSAIRIAQCRYHYEK